MVTLHFAIINFYSFSSHLHVIRSLSVTDKLIMKTSKMMQNVYRFIILPTSCVSGLSNDLIVQLIKLTVVIKARNQLPFFLHRCIMVMSVYHHLFLNSLYPSILQKPLTI